MPTKQSATLAELEGALKALVRDPVKLSAADWPHHEHDLDEAGLYSWWVDSEGAQRLNHATGLPIATGLIYIGEAGARRLSSFCKSSATLSTRIGDNHIFGRIRNSTFRRTLSAILLKDLNLRVTESKKLDGDSENRLTDWIRAHLAIAVYPFPHRYALEHLEKQVLAQVNPPLNLRGLPLTPLRRKISQLRQTVIRAMERANAKTASDVTDAINSSPKGKSTNRGPIVTRIRRFTLHQEIADILDGEDTDWLTTKEIAELVNERRRYQKKDGSAVTAFQIHGRTRNYPHLFERDGSLVRLKEQRSNRPST